jgi:FtsZ-binding cell division protein ZapB
VLAARGGKAAAHYEPGRRVINLTKLSGAGTLAHEYGHALDHYLGWVSGEDKQPSVGSFAQGKFEIKNKHLPLKLRTAINRLMHDFHEVEEDDAAAEARLRRHIESAKHGQAGWQEHLRKLRERKAKGGSAAGVTQAETQVEVWGRKIKMLESELESGRKKSVPSKYLTNASELSGKTGDYWKRPTELFARAFEAYAYDKIEADGFQSQYLVQGVEPNRFGNGFRGNPYPAGDERARINADFDRVFRAIEVTEGKLGAQTRMQGMAGEPEPVETVQKVARPAAQPTGAAEVHAMDEAKADSLSGAFFQHFGAGRGFKGILEARKFAKDAGFTDDPKAIEEAIEYARREAGALDCGTAFHAGEEVCRAALAL